MLSFMKESQAEELLDKTTETSTPEKGGADAANQAFLTVSGQEKKVRNSTVVVLILFSLAAVGLFLMAKQSRPQAAAASVPGPDGQAQLETAISRLTGVRAQMLSQMDRVVQKFYEFSDVMQIEVKDLQKNPFQLEVFASDTDNASDPFGQAEKAVRTLREQFQRESKTLTLSSIITSDEGGRRCRINEELLSEGQRIGNFQVINIAETQVQLRWEPDDTDIAQLTPEERVTTLTLK